ncbi:MAG: oligosaccharide flippase family protein [Bacteroidota bacterium]
MIDKILRLGKEAAIYGLSSIVGRFLNFLLVPFYTNLLLPSEYGVIANLYAYIAFAAVLFGYGMDAAYMRFVASMEIGDKKQNFSIPFISVAVTSFLFSTALHANAGFVAEVIGIPAEESSLIRLAAWVLFFDAVALVPYASLRMENKAGTFAVIRIFNIVLTIVLNIAFLVVFEMRAEGVLLANLVASALTLIVQIRWIIPNFTLAFSSRLYKELLRFGLPYVPAGLASIAMQVIDRPILKLLTNDATVGIYQANYRMGVFMMLVVGMFDYAWRPFFLKHADKPDAKPLFARVFTLFSVVAMTLLVLLTLFIDDLIRVRLGGVHFIHPDYWSGAVIIPIVLLAYVFNGAYVNFLVGIYLKKKTSILPVVFGLSALVNIAANLLLIPEIGIMGAAYATLLSYVVLAVGIYIPSQRYYRIEYEWETIVRLLAVTTLILSVFKLLPLEPGSVDGLLAKTGLAAAFIVLVLFARIIKPGEFRKTQNVVERLSDSSAKK